MARLKPAPVLLIGSDIDDFVIKSVSIVSMIDFLVISRIEAFLAIK